VLRNIPKIKLYGADHCHKTHYYQLILDEIGLPYKFFDVEKMKHMPKSFGIYMNIKN